MKNKIEIQDLSHRDFTLAGNAFSWKFSIEDLKLLMEKTGVSVAKISSDLDIPESRVRAVLNKPRSVSQNVHMNSTRTLIGMYLHSGLWDKADVVYRKLRLQPTILKPCRKCKCYDGIVYASIDNKHKRYLVRCNQCGFTTETASSKKEAMEEWGMK